MPKIREVPGELLINPEKNKAALQAQQKAEKQQEPKVEAEGGPQLNVK